MFTGLTWRSLLVGAFLLLSVVFLVPTIFPTLPAWWKGPFLPTDKLSLGLDLQGGTHLVLEVETAKAVEAFFDLMAGDLEEEFGKKNIHFRSLGRVGEDRLVVALFDRESLAKVQALVKERYPELSQGQPAGGDPLSLEISLSPQQITQRKDQAVQQALETIRNRVDQFGVSEPLIRREGKDSIVVQLPGIKDPQRAIELIGRTARLEFRLVNETVNATTATPGTIGLDEEILIERSIDPMSGAVSQTPLVVKKRASLTGDMLTNAQIEYERQFNRPYVSMEFNSVGAKLFDEITAANVGKRFAIVLDNNIYSAPLIRERISGGRAQISGSFSDKEATDLAIVLRSGSLPAPVKIIQNVTVGPTLGQDSIHKGLMAGVIGVLLVVLFMLFYYRLSGLVANYGMVLNIIYLLGFLALFGATLTLPGIAAIVLLIGMSVDANVLIFERIREELRLGKTPLAALEAGYDKAFLTIMDSHVTTLITAVVLFQFGTGPVKGFAVSLFFGVTINLFSSLVATREVFDFFLKRGKVKKLSI
ncbi:MAG TPA: protein translocase subunit SecD [Geobacterales bacterium]|nr:protein translocase subunit SecD [Geobacterales bacterium]